MDLSFLSTSEIPAVTLSIRLPKDSDVVMTKKVITPNLEKYVEAIGD